VDRGWRLARRARRARRAPPGVSRSARPLRHPVPRRDLLRLRAVSSDARGLAARSAGPQLLRSARPCPDLRSRLLGPDPERGRCDHCSSRCLAPVTAGGSVLAARTEPLSPTGLNGECLYFSEISTGSEDSPPAKVSWFGSTSSGTSKTSTPSAE